MPDIDNLNIKIKADADAARKSLNGLIGDLRDLKNANKNAFNGEGFEKQARQMTDYEKAVKNAAREFAESWSVSSREGMQTVQTNFKALMDGMLNGFKDTTKLWNQLSDSVKTHAKFVDEAKTQYKDLLEYVRNTNRSVTGDVGKIRLGFDSSELGDDYKRMSAIAGKAFVASDKGVGTGDFENYITELNEKLGNIIPVGNTAADTFRNFVAVLQDAREKTMSFNEALGRGAFGDGVLDESINTATEQLYNAFKNDIPQAIEATDQEVKKLEEDFSFLDGVKVHGMNGEFVFNEGELVPVREEMERIAELADEIRVATSDTGPVLHPIPEELMSPQQLAESNAQMQSVEKETEKTLSFSERIREIWEHIKDSFGNAKSKASETADSIRDESSAANDLAKSAIKIENPISNIKTSINQITKGLKKSFSTFLKYSIGVRSTYALINKIRSGLIEGLKSIVQYSDETNKSISMLRNSFTQFKNSVAAAVTPIINAFAPAINTIIELCTKAVNAVNQLISALLGRDTWIKAKKGTEDYAQSLNKASKAAKNGLRAFDELNVINTNNGSGSGTTNVAEMFETVDVESKFKDLAEKIRTALQPITDDFKSLWQHITEGDWFAVGQDVNSIATDIWNLFSDAIDQVDWEGIGNKIGEFLAGLDWLDLLTKWLEFKFKIWEAIINVIKGSFQKAPLETAFLTAFATLKFTGIGSLIGKAILKNVRGYIAKNAGKLFAGIGISKLFGTGTAAKIGLTLGKGILGGVGAAIAGFWAGSSLAKLLMGDNAPDMSTLEIVKELIDGIVNGDLWGAIGDWFSDLTQGIALVLSNAFTWLWESIVGIWNGVAGWFNENVIQPLVDFFEPATSRISAFFEGCWIIIQAVWVIASEWFDEKVIQPIAEFFTWLWDLIESAAKATWDWIVSVWEGVSTWFDEKVIQPIAGIFSWLWDGICSAADWAWNNVLSPLWEDIVDFFDTWVVQPISKLFDWLWEGIESGFRGVANFIVGMFEGVINGMIDAVNWFIKGFSDIVEWAGDIIGQDWGGIKLLERVNLQRYENGGFPYQGSLFVAGETIGKTEWIGDINGRTGVVSGTEITGIANAIYSTSQEEMELLRQQNSLLQGILQKEFGITTSDIGRAAQSYNQDYKKRTGRPAYT